MREVKNRDHWSHYKEEVKTYLPLKFTLFLFKILPIVCLRIFTFPVGFFYYMISKRARNESKRYLEKMKSETGKRLHPLFHIIAFSLTLVEKIEGWAGNQNLGNRIHYQKDDVDELINLVTNGKGVFLIASHLGNIEFARALADIGGAKNKSSIPITVIVDFSVTSRFNQMLKELNAKSMTRIISANNVGPDTVIMLIDKLENGELVSIAGDRTSAHTNKCVIVPFLGADAPFAYGPFLLSALLNVPTFFAFALRRKDVSLSCEYDMHIHRSAINFDCSRKEREQRIKELAKNYVHYLQLYCKEHPYQWYNFFDFWGAK
ncbi:MAG: hypothetical protein LBV52_02440 [Spirochaetaceae bacterium]|jgi:predicted LPLAT superfamily acyltransferase|nr:hypothetical protein [Spirochaetaceae bacterium]